MTKGRRYRVTARRPDGLTRTMIAVYLGNEGGKDEFSLRPLTARTTSLDPDLIVAVELTNAPVTLSRPVGGD